MFGRGSAFGRGGRGGSVDPLAGSKPGAAPLTQGRSATATRTSGGAAESSFTTTTVTLPKSAKPRDVLITVNAGAVLVQVQGAGKEFISAVATVNTPAVIDISHLPESTTVDVQTEILTATTTMAIAVGYD